MTTPDRDYRFPPAPARAEFTREIADQIHGSIGARLRAIESKRSELQDLIDDLSFAGTQRLDAAIYPLIETVRADLETLRTGVAATLIENQRIIDDFKQVTAVNLEELENKIVEVEQRIATILAGGLDAADVRESASRVFVTSAQRTRLAALMQVVDGGTF